MGTDTADTATTTELFDCSIGELPVNARTRGALKRANITTLSGLERALRSDDDLPGLGPKAAEDIGHALDALETDGERRAAVQLIFAAHGRVANLLMEVTDLMLAGDERLDKQAVRTATAKLLRESLRDTTRAVRVLAPEVPEMECEAEDSERVPA